MSPIKAIIIDDEEHGRLNLESLILQYCPGVSITGKAESATEARTLMLADPPDLVFLDIEMPDENGIDFLATLDNFREYSVVLVTAHKQYAIEAIKHNATDYLLKPINIKELQMAIQKATYKKMQHLNQADEGLYTRICLPSPKGGYEIVETAQIIRMEGDNNYTSIITSDKKHVVARTLKDFEKLLDKPAFIRVHKTHIINLQFVKHVNQYDGGLVTMSDGASIHISRRRYNEFISRLGFFAPVLK